MMLFRDMCFCATKTCKKRKECARALENYDMKDTRGNFFSLADFNCDNRDTNSMFMRLGGV